jgi:hypothetical protein
MLGEHNGISWLFRSGEQLIMIRDKNRVSIFGRNISDIGYTSAHYFAR